MILRDLRKRGLKPWRCTIADGHLGLWAALSVYWRAVRRWCAADPNSSAAEGSLIVQEATFSLYESGKAPTYRGDLPPEEKRARTGP